MEEEWTVMEGNSEAIAILGAVWGPGVDDMGPLGAVVLQGRRAGI